MGFFNGHLAPGKPALPDGSFRSLRTCHVPPMSKIKWNETKINTWPPRRMAAWQAYVVTHVGDGGWDGLILEDERRARLPSSSSRGRRRPPAQEGLHEQESPQRLVARHLVPRPPHRRQHQPPLVDHHIPSHLHKNHSPRERERSSSAKEGGRKGRRGEGLLTSPWAVHGRQGDSTRRPRASTENRVEVTGTTPSTSPLRRNSEVIFRTLRQSGGFPLQAYLYTKTRTPWPMSFLTSGSTVFALSFQPTNFSLRFGDCVEAQKP